MVSFLAYLIFSILSLIAAIHVYWAMGGFWPAQNRANLPRAVVGTNDAEMPSKALTLLVAFIIFLAGVIPFVWTGILPAPIDRWVQAFVITILALIFIGRGLITYTPVAARYLNVEPFATLNRQYYSPLCLVIGMGFVAILMA